MVRSILAIILGFAIIGVFVTATDQLFALALPGFEQLPVKPDKYYLISLVTSSLYSVIGGWTCAWIAKRNIRQHAIALVILGELAGIAALVALWNIVPHYYTLLLLVLYPPAVMLGAKIYGASHRSVLAAQ
jgi:hypothetical protein